MDKIICKVCGKMMGNSLGDTHQKCKNNKKIDDKIKCSECGKDKLHDGSICKCELNFDIEGCEEESRDN